MDARQDSIVMQNAMARAVEIELYRAARENRDVDIRATMELAKTMALVLRAPNLDEHQAKIMKGK